MKGGNLHTHLEGDRISNRTFDEVPSSNLEVVSFL